MTCRVLQAPSSGGGSGGAKTAAAPTAPPRHATFSDYVTTSFMRRISPATFEIISRSGIRWHNAANKALVIAVLRNYIIDNDIDGLADHYDTLRDKSDKGEKKWLLDFFVAHSMLRASIGSMLHSLSTVCLNPHPTNHNWCMSRKRYSVPLAPAWWGTNHPAEPSSNDRLRNQPKGAQCSHLT